MSLRGQAGLGRGLSALLGESSAGADSGRDGVRQIDIAAIRPNPAQPRRRFDDEPLTELADSIRQHGVLQPILVRPTVHGYEIIAGERRWRAAQRAGLHRIPALIREFEGAITAEVALIENIQREDLNALEEAEGYRQLIRDHGHSQDQLAAIIHKSRSHVTNMLRLLDLPASVQEQLRDGALSMGHARALAASPDAEAIAAEVVAKGLSVRQTEARVRSGKAANDPKPKAEVPIDADLSALERQLGDLLGLKVRIAHGSSGGSVTLQYSSLDQLDMICQRLTGEPI
jgi:ParB family transcriptional regulator, chromosome partitioning protein